MGKQEHLPTVAVTIRAPLYEFFHHGKNLLNREHGEHDAWLRHIGCTLGITTGTSFSQKDIRAEVAAAKKAKWLSADYETPDYLYWRAHLGQLLWTAKIHRVWPAWNGERRSWGIESKVHVELTDVRPVTPIPASGAPGLWTVVVCSKCEGIYGTGRGRECRCDAHRKEKT